MSDTFQVVKPPSWIAASTSETAFAYEQKCLGLVWTFVGFSSDLPNEGDWFSTTLGGRSIFVQRFKNGLRAFENRCAHRFYPLRTKEKGNGPIVCGFHHWRYNSEGEALGIPKSTEMFNCIPRELGKALKSLDIDCCGNLIFARFPNHDNRETLKDFLAEGYHLIAGLSAAATPPHRFTQDVKANWKFSHHISLDDYHLVAVHPNSFGKSGYLDPDTVHYHRFGRHSAFFHTLEDVSFSDVAAAFARQDYTPSHYIIVNIFPNFLISFYEVRDVFGSLHWYASALRYRPVAHDRTEVHSWLYPVSVNTEQKPISVFLRPFLNRTMPPIVAHFARKIMNEDNEICEGLQSIAHQVDALQTLSRFEQRIGWFEEAYSEALQAKDRPDTAKNLDIDMADV
jgi:phenylpropionate dioxygenase-like ring-hydroxylating dioxygenase large terminal subunit